MEKELRNHQIRLEAFEGIGILTLEEVAQLENERDAAWDETNEMEATLKKLQHSQSSDQAAFLSRETSAATVFGSPTDSGAEAAEASHTLSQMINSKV